MDTKQITAHKHEVLEVVELYRRDKPTKIELVKCKDCNTAFPELMEEMQERQNELFKMLGDKSPVAFFDPKIEWVEQKTWIQNH